MSKTNAPAYIVVDRIEGDMAVLSIGNDTYDIPLVALPEGISEGQSVRFELDADGPSRQRVADRLARLQAKANISDDFSL